MNKEIVHYMHFNKLWYYWLDESESKKYWRKLDGDDDNVCLLSEGIITEHQCREKLRSMFPDNKIMKAIPFHYSPSNHGSRHIKHTVNRKREVKEKILFRKELESFVEMNSTLLLRKGENKKV